MYRLCQTCRGLAAGGVPPGRLRIRRQRPLPEREERLPRLRTGPGGAVPSTRRSASPIGRHQTSYWCAV